MSSFPAPGDAYAESWSEIDSLLAGATHIRVIFSVNPLSFLLIKRFKGEISATLHIDSNF